MSHKKNKGAKEEELIKKMNHLGKKFYKLGVIDHIGALSQINLKNATRFFQEYIREDSEKGMNGVSERQGKNLSWIAEKLYELSH